MNKYATPLLAWALLMGSAQAQVINNVTPSTTTIYEIDANVSFEDVGPGGANTTWDFSDIGSSGTYFMGYQPAAAGAGSEHFPDATHVEIADAGIGGNWNYFDFSGGTWRILGSYSSFGSTENILTYADPHEYFTVPLSLGSSGADTYANHTLFILFDWTKAGTCAWEVDGSGTLILPTSTHTDVLRVRMDCDEVEHMGTTLLRNNDITHHLWVKEGIGHPLLMHTHIHSVNVDDGDVDESYLVKVLASVEFNVSTEDAALPELGVHPNPAGEYILLKTAENTSFASTRIVDVRGRTVGTFGGSEVRLEVGGLAPGVYTVVRTGQAGTVRAQFIKR